MSWVEHAACIGAPFEWFFPSSENFVDPRAKALCDICTVLPDCAEHARNEPKEVWVKP